MVRRKGKREKMSRSIQAALLIVAFIVAACASDDRKDREESVEQSVAISGNYAPSSDALNAAAGVTINMMVPPAWAADGSSCSGGLLPGTTKLAEYVKGAFSGISRIETYWCRPNTANLSQTSTHGVGWALDIHIPMDNGAADNSVGDPIANWLISNAGTLGVQFLVWDKTQYTTSGPSASRVAIYSGPIPHVDHIHFELAPSYAANSNLSIPGVPAWQGSFQFNLDSNNVYGCTDAVTGGESTNWIYSCQNRQTVFQPGQNANMVIRVDNVQRNVAFSIEAWRLGQSSPDWTWTDSALQVEPNVWPHAFYLPRFNNVYAGDWDMRIYANTGSGPFQLTTFHFIVPGGSQQWPGSPYQYNGNNYNCNGSVTGGASTNWIYTCNGQQSSYAAGDNVTVLMRIDNVTSSHRFRARIFHNGSFLYTTSPTGWNDVPTGETWQYAHYWTTIGNVISGSYEARVDIDLPGGTEFENVNVAIIPFTVNPVAPFIYNGNAVTCSNEPTGGQSTNWIYTCPRPATVFSQGQNVRVLSFVQDVRQSYRFRSRFYRNGSSTVYSEQVSDWTTVPSGQVWSTAYTWPTLWYALSGNWRASVEIDVGGGWQMLRSDITFTVNAPIGGYTSSSFNVCLGNYQNERDANGVPQCWTPVSSQSSLSSLSTYYWRLRFTGLAVNTNVQFRIEAYHSGTLGWSWDFGPYLPASNGESWFFPEFANPGPGNWELLFFLKIGSGSFQQVDAHLFFAY
ncbi:MAG: peptidoglycan-binding domain 1 protein [Parcubacteria group bacterium Gr01-1014_13]|nr:MAG: peptidoglycan-binding domain 1 protein [Parcubacteria group bacterium Gr01-1014_13]